MSTGNGSSKGEGSRRAGGSVYDHVRRPPERRGLRETLHLLRTGVSIVWSAGRREFVITAVAQTVAAVALTLQLIVAEALLDAIVDSDEALSFGGDVVWPLVVLVATILVLGVATGVQSELSLLLGEKVGRRASDEVLAVACAVDLEEFESPEFFDQLQRARFAAGSRNMAIARAVLGVLGAGLATAGVLAALLAVAPALVPIAALAAVPLWVAASRNSRLYHEFTHSMTATDRERNYLWEALTDRDKAKEVRAYEIAGFLKDRHDRLYDTRIGRLQVLVRSRLRRSVIGSLAGSALMAVMLVALLLMLQRGWLTIGAVGAALLASLVLGQRLRAALTHVAGLYESALFIEDFNTFLDLKPAGGAPTELVPALPEFDRLVAEGLQFSYPGASRPAIDDVNIEIRKGEVVALVGENGSGKTTTAKLLAGLYAPTGGRILWDEQDVQDRDPQHLRRSVTAVFQDFVKWYLPARWNIGLGRVEAMDDEARVVGAAQRAQAHEFISKLDDGYDTVLSRLFAGGTDLSVGQWQRIALARAFFREAPFVIMDEPTASLDPLAEFQIFRTIRDALEGRTLLLISHRFSSVGLADRIYVLSEGRVVEHGSHDELMANAGHYARLFTLQAAAYLGEDVEPV